MGNLTSFDWVFTLWKKKTGKWEEQAVKYQGVCGQRTNFGMLQTVRKSNKIFQKVVISMEIYMKIEMVSKKIN